MFFRSLILAACLLAAPSVHAEQVVPLTIGGTQVQFPVPEGYVRSSEAAPAHFAQSAAAIPPDSRLVEMMVTPDDAKRVLLGQNVEQAFMQVQTVRAVEALEISAADWRELQPLVVKQIGGQDMQALMEKEQGAMGERLSSQSGTDIDVSFEGVGKPTVYSVADDVVRFSMQMPLKGSVNGEVTIDTVLDCAGATLVLNGKLMNIAVYQIRGPLGSNMGAVREILEKLVVRARELNEAG